MVGHKLIVTTIDLPYPINCGHKVDQFNRWRAFAEQGWRMKLICWRSPLDPPSTAQDMAVLSTLFETVDVLPIRHDLSSFARRLALLWRYPSHVASRIPNSATTARLIDEARAFAPAAIVHDGIYGAALGNRLASACRVPTILRGHNVEHVYFAQQARAAKNVRDKLAWTIAQLGLERWERKITREAAWAFQISADDVAFWKAQGFENVSWAPTVYPDSPHGSQIPTTERDFDVSYIGNMRLPNNLQGLTWFVREVLPQLRKLRQGTTLCFAGAHPSDEAYALFAEAPDITLIPNAPSADDVLRNGRVLVNPILSGSGINVKSIDMLRHDTPIVTTSIGVQGFPLEIRHQFLVRDDAFGFASAIAAALDEPAVPLDRSHSRSAFGKAGLDEQISKYSQVALRG